MRRRAGSELTPTQMAFLAVISRHEGLTPGRLAEIEGVKRPSVTRVIAGLTTAGLIERRPDPADGRSCHLFLTEAGRAYVDGQRRRRNAWLATVLDGLGPEDQETLLRAAAILDAAVDRDLESNR